jgi:hypothetical protein
MAKIFDSGLLDFAEDESQYIEVVHNLGASPQVVQFMGELKGEVGFPVISGTGGPYITDITNPVSLKVYKPNAYAYTGQFRICIFD